MDKIYCDLELDFSENKSLKVIKVKQFENRGRDIRLFLYDNGREVIFDGAETATINASVNGVVTTYNENCIVVYGKNCVDIPLYSSLTTLAGKEQCEVKIAKGSEGTIYTATFVLDVEPSVATSESAAVLKTTELAATLSGLDSRVTVLENDSTDVEEYIDTAKSAIIDKIDTSESNIESAVSTSEANIKTAVLNKIGTPTNNTVSQDISDSKTAVLNKLGSGAITIDDRIDNAKSNINDNIDTAKNSLSSKITSSLISVDTWLTNVQTALSEEIEDVRGEFEEKYDELMYEMKKSEKTILREIKSLADELAVGNSVITGSSTLITQGAISQSYAGTITRGDS